MTYLFVLFFFNLILNLNCVNIYISTIFFSCTSRCMFYITYELQRSIYVCTPLFTCCFIVLFVCYIWLIPQRTQAGQGNADSHSMLIFDTLSAIVVKFFRVVRTCDCQTTALYSGNPAMLFAYTVYTQEMNGTMLDTFFFRSKKYRHLNSKNDITDFSKILSIYLVY